MTRRAHDKTGICDELRMRTRWIMRQADRFSLLHDVQLVYVWSLTAYTWNTWRYKHIIRFSHTHFWVTPRVFVYGYGWSFTHSSLTITDIFLCERISSQTANYSQFHLNTLLMSSNWPRTGTLLNKRELSCDIIYLHKSTLDPTRASLYPTIF